MKHKLISYPVFSLLDDLVFTKGCSEGSCMGVTGSNHIHDKENRVFEIGSTGFNGSIVVIKFSQTEDPASTPCNIIISDSEGNIKARHHVITKKATLVWNGIAKKKNMNAYILKILGEHKISL